jgi:hypothetical protein
MTELLIVSLSTAFIVTAVEELIYSIGKFKGLLALACSFLGAYFTVSGTWGLITFTAIASSFAGMFLSMSAMNLIETRDSRTVRNLPRRIPPL